MPTVYEMCVQLGIDHTEIEKLLGFNSKAIDPSILHPYLVEEEFLKFELYERHPQLYRQLKKFTLFQPPSLVELTRRQLCEIFSEEGKEISIFKHTEISNFEYESNVKKSRSDFFKSIPKSKREQFVTQLRKRIKDPKCEVTTNYIQYLCELMGIEAGPLLESFKRYQDADELYKDYVNSQWYTRYEVILDAIESGLEMNLDSPLESFLRICPGDLMDEVNRIDDEETLKKFSRILKLTNREQGRFVNKRVPLATIRNSRKNTSRAETTFWFE